MGPTPRKTQERPGHQAAKSRSHRTDDVSMDPETLLRRFVVDVLVYPETLLKRFVVDVLGQHNLAN